MAFGHGKSWQLPSRISPISSQALLFLEIQQRNDLIERGIAHHAQPDKFHGPLARALASKKLQLQRGDERAVKLDDHAFVRFGHEVTAAEDAFEPFEKQVNLPSIMIDKGDEFDLHF